MREIGAYEAKTHLPRLLKAVEEGETIAITRHGQRIALLVPAVSEPQRSISETISALRDFRKGKRLGDMSVAQMRKQGRR